MAISKNCPECDSTDLLVQNGIDTRGGYGPDLLPGASGVFASGKMRVVVCKNCGLIRYFASKEALSKIAAKDGRWDRLL